MFLPEQLKPSPEKPVLQTQLNEPMVLIHLALTSQTGTEASHSSASEQRYHRITITKRIGPVTGACCSSFLKRNTNGWQDFTWRNACFHSIVIVKLAGEFYTPNKKIMTKLLD